MSRDLLNHGSGKGDKPRSKFDKNWHDRFSVIQGFQPADRAGFTKTKRGWIKKY
jgi:hypothetical protein